MRRSTIVVLGMACLTNLLLAALRADEPAKKSESVKLPWQRRLQGEDARKVAELEKQLRQRIELENLAEALKIAESIMEIRSSLQGSDHFQTIDARWDIEAVRRVMRRGAEAQKDYATTFALACQYEALNQQGRYKEAQPVLEKLLSVYRKALGEDHPHMVGVYTSLGSNLCSLGKYEQAHENLHKALAIQLRLRSEEHPETAAIHNNLAYNLDHQGKHSEAEGEYRKALDIDRKVLGEEAPRTVITYSNAAFNLYYQGKYTQAEEALRKALAIHRGRYGEEHPHTAVSYNNLAMDLQAQGRYQEAEDDYRKALAIRRKVLGEEHPDTAQSWNNLAADFSSQNKYAEAEEGFGKALAIYRRVAGENHPDTGRSWNNLGFSLYMQRKYSKAEECYSKALDIRLKVLSENHPDIAQTWNNRAMNLKAQGKYREAEDGLRKALAIRRKSLGEEHPETAHTWNNLASYLDAQGKHEEAREVYQKALSLLRKALGEKHLYTAIGYHNVAINLNARGEYEEAEKLWQLASEIFTKARLRVASSGLERAAFTSKYSSLPDLAAVLARNGKLDDAWQRFEESLARGTWDDLSARLSRSQAERDQQAQITARIDRLNKLIERTNVAKLTNEQNKQREDWLSQLRQAYDDLDAFTKQLEEKHGPIAGQVSRRSQIQAALPADAALIAWLDNSALPKAADPNGEHWAILLRSTGDPIWVRLSGAGDKDAWTDTDTRLPAELRAALRSRGGQWEPMVQRLRKQRLEPLAHHLEGVRRLIVLPSTALAGVPVEVIADGYTVSYAHSGTMYAHLLQQRAPASKGLFVLADPVFETSSLADKPIPLPPGGVLLTVVVPGSNATSAGLKPNDVLLRYGETELHGPKDFKPQPASDDPDKRVPVIVWREGTKLSRPLFVHPGKLGVVVAPEPAPQAVAEQRRIDRLLASRSGDYGKWDRLPSTRIEAASLQRLFGTEPSRLLLDSDSSEQQLNELASSGELGKYRYLHLATHGQVNDDFPLRSAVILSRDHLPDEQQRTKLLVSGKPIPDGCLTAEEALQRWNLHCDLVTLSACQTALGKYERGEGFIGFAQSLILCGARSVCLSLWKVDDMATALLMERFYQNLLGQRGGLKTAMPKAAAMAEAKEWLRTLSRAEAIKHAAFLTNGVDRGKRPNSHDLEIAKVSAPAEPAKNDCPFAHPYYWAAFVLVGHAE